MSKITGNNGAIYLQRCDVTNSENIVESITFSRYDVNSYHGQVTLTSGEYLSKVISIEGEYYETEITPHGDIYVGGLSAEGTYDVELIKVQSEFSGDVDGETLYHVLAYDSVTKTIEIEGPEGVTVRAGDCALMEYGSGFREFLFIIAETVKNRYISFSKEPSFDPVGTLVKFFPALAKVGCFFEYTLDRSVGTIDATCFEDSANGARTFISDGLKTWTASATKYFVTDDYFDWFVNVLQQEPCLIIFERTGTDRLIGWAILTTDSQSASPGTIVQNALSFQGSGLYSRES